MKVVIIGCTHAGTAAAVNTKKNFPDAEVTVYERNQTISFLSCGIALYVGGVVKDPQGLFYSSPAKLAEIGVATRMGHDVLAVDAKAKTITVKDLATGNEFHDFFDKLIVTTGSWPIVPPIPGVDLPGILLSKNWDHSNAIIETAKSAKRIVVIGGGYIGVELAEAFAENGKEVVLLDSKDRILFRYLDKGFTDLAEAELRAHGIRLGLGETVQRFEAKNGKVAAVHTDKGRYEADMVILSVGFKPNTVLLKGQVDMTPHGAIVVDDWMRSSNPDVFAAGDSAAVRYNPIGRSEYIPLATNAVRMGMLAALNLEKPAVRYRGTQGTSGIKIFEQNIASTGLTVEAAAGYGIEVESVEVKDNIRPEFMPTYEPFRLTVVYRASDRRVVGAQVASKADLTQTVNALSIAIQAGFTMEDLAFVDLFFQPHYNKPWNWINSAGLQTVGR
jgi:NADPH-dependent 2,4-dienoyl-CoA reductase/sulfur reductase-like enzyme